MNSASREDYLKNCWKKYPAARDLPTLLTRGRLISFQVGTPHSLQIKLNSQQDSIETVDFFLNESPSNYRPSQVLKEGDLVGLVVDSSQTKIILITPHEGSFYFLQEALNSQALWGDFLFYLRGFFREREFLEVQTPSLVACPGTEPFLESFEVDLKFGNHHIKKYLPTSPELHLKKMLGMGFDKIYEVAKSYRNTEFSDTHQPEFWMLEWYRAYAGIEDIEKDICDLIKHLHLKLSKNQSQKPLQIVKKSMAELFLEKLNFQLSPQTTKQELNQLAVNLGLISQERAESFSWDEIFLLVFIDKIEYQWNPEQIMIVHSYPPSQAAYSRLNSQGWGERFELYWKGMELANAFHEVNDPEIQIQRFNEDLKKKKENGLPVVDLDPEFIEMLKSGMPPSGGIAMGIERLFMALAGLKSFKEWKLFLHQL